MIKKHWRGEPDSDFFGNVFCDKARNEWRNCEMQYAQDDEHSAGKPQNKFSQFCGHLYMVVVIRVDECVVIS
jgi:hypothetical protein